MITCDLDKRDYTLDELLSLAKNEAVRVVQTDGSEFILAPSESFEEEVDRLGNNDRFMQFLAERSNDRHGRSLDEIDRDLKRGDEE